MYKGAVSVQGFGVTTNDRNTNKRRSEGEKPGTRLLLYRVWGLPPYFGCDGQKEKEQNTKAEGIGSDPDCGGLVAAEGLEGGIGNGPGANLYTKAARPLVGEMAGSAILRSPMEITSG